MGVLCGYLLFVNRDTAGLDRKLTTGNVAPYWSDHSTEVIFLVSTLMPNSDKNPDHSHKVGRASSCASSHCSLSNVRLKAIYSLTAVVTGL
jgi:hypothetical protein